jgi:16S rRNA processing protein RimM
MTPRWLNVGKVANTHGIRGEVKVWPETDFPNERFVQGRELWLTHPSDDSLRILTTVASARQQKNVYIIKFQEFNDINEVEKYKGWSLKVDGERKARLAPHEFYYHEVIGCEVFTEQGELIGRVDSILRPGANDVWVVQLSTGKLAYIPYIADVVLTVDTNLRKVTIRLMEGLIE